MLFGPFLIPRVASTLCFGLIFWAYLIIITFDQDFSCLQSRWGLVTNLFAVAMEIYEFQMVLYLYFLTAGRTSMASLLLDYKHSFTYVVSVLLTLVVMLVKGDGESDPITCWHLAQPLHDVAINSIIQLLLFLLPFLVIHLPVTGFLLYRISYFLDNSSSYGKFPPLVINSQNIS